MPTIDRVISTAPTGVNIYRGADQVPLHYRFWSSKTVSNPIVVYVHGIEGHGLWFDRAASELSKQGINVYAADRAGAGLNRDINDSFIHKTLLSDLNSFLKVIKLQHPDSRLFLLGNCWGGTLSILYAEELCKHSQAAAPDTSSAAGKNLVPISGLILSCPAIKTLCDVNWLTKLSIGWSYLINSKKEFPFPLTPNMFTDNPDYLEFINYDELRTTRANAHFLVETLKMQYLANQAATYIDLPVLMLQAGKDAIVDKRATTKWFERLKSRKKNYYLFDTSCHSLDFEPDISTFLDAVTGWIQESKRG